MTQSLILKRASASRSSGQWRDDDFDVLEDGVIVGRIFCLDNKFLYRKLPYDPESFEPITNAFFNTQVLVV